MKKKKGNSFERHWDRSPYVSTAFVSLALTHSLEHVHSISFTELIKQKKLEKHSSTCRFSPSMLLWTSSSLKVYNYYCSSERKISRWSSEYNHGGIVCRILSFSWQTSNEWWRRKRKSPLASFNLNACFLPERWWTGNGKERERARERGREPQCIYISSSCVLAN